ncbi:helix-turn-helix domain-containing protein [Streptomyces sp. NPDC059832]|uniref:AraC-like ligand-binding domain-containing protein n=1 Tax=Streptomyces sp. NPDC059832 TaxID=3346966 RepID=UPI003652D432
MVTVLDTTCLPPAGRTTAWAETTALALVNTRFRFPDPANFGAFIRATTLGPAQLSMMSYAQLFSYRSAQLIRKSDPELYQIAMITEGEQVIEQAGNRAVLEPGDIVVYDSSRPFQASALGVRGCSSVLLQFPRHLMPLPDKVVAPLCGTVLSGAAGVGHVFCQTLVSMVAAEPELSVHDRQRLGTTVIDVATAVIAQHTDRAPLLQPETRKAALYSEITAYISRHLHDPDLKPTAVAAVHNISPRYLHRVFQDHGTTVNTFIRQGRIARCRRDLLDPALHDTPVSAIGARWGYARASDFTRAFRTATGMTPTEYRGSNSRA